MNKRRQKRTCLIAIASELLWNPVFIERYGYSAAVDIANELLRRAKFPIGIKVPKPEQVDQFWIITQNDYSAKTS